MTEEYFLIAIVIFHRAEDWGCIATLKISVNSLLHVKPVFTYTEGKRFLYNTREVITDRRLQRYHDMTNSTHELTTSVIEGNQAEWWNICYSHENWKNIVL